MSLQELKNKTNKKRKRIGRGNASGHGTYSCRGMNGQTSRSGGKRRPGFEGGQTPYIRRIPKLKGFKNPNRVEFQVVNLGQLNVFNDNDTVNLEALLEKKLVSKKNRPVKLLAGKGDLEKSLKIVIDKASGKAIEAVKAKKGSVETKMKTTEKVEKKVEKAETKTEKAEEKTEKAEEKTD